jgi:iduronate 2-sulfatase
MDAQVGKVLDALEKSGRAGDTIVIFTADHGYHLGEHDFWAKVSLRDESAMVPLIVKVPGKKPTVCHSLVELIDLYPTLASLCGLEIPPRLQGRDLSPLFDDPARSVRDAAFCVAPSSKGFLLREEKWAYLQYAEDASKGIELFDTEEDPEQYANLASRPEHQRTVERFKAKLAAKLEEIRTNDLEPRRP